MPSGAKKRKAAKRKKEKGASNPSTHPHGDGDLKVSSTMSGHSDEYHSITEEEIEKKNKNSSSVRSENVDKVGKSSSSSSSSRSSGTSSGSSSDDESNSVEKNIVMVESNDPSDLPEVVLLGEEDSSSSSSAAAAAILEEQKLEVTVTQSSTVDLGVPPFQDHNSLEDEKEKKNSADKIDLEEGEVCNNSVTDPSSSTSINQDILVSLVEEEEMGEEKYIVLEENTAINTAAESKLNIDQSVSNTIETSFQEHKGKDYQSTVIIAGSVERQQAENSPPKVLQRTSFASCCGLFELFSGSNR